MKLIIKLELSTRERAILERILGHELLKRSEAEAALISVFHTALSQLDLPREPQRAPSRLRRRSSSISERAGSRGSSARDLRAATKLGVRRG